MKVCLYARVSKALDQNPENQLIELTDNWYAPFDDSDFRYIMGFINDLIKKK